MKHIQDRIKPGPIIDFIVAGQNLMTTLSTLLINSILVVGMFFYQLFTLQPAFVVDRVPSILLSILLFSMPVLLKLYSPSPISRTIFRKVN